MTAGETAESSRRAIAGGSAVLVALLLVLAVASALGLAAATGLWTTLVPDRLEAEVDVQEFALPAGFAVDPEAIAADLSARLQSQAEDDLAIRTLIGGERSQQVVDVLIPRLMSTTVIRRLILDSETLGAVVATDGYQGFVSGSVRNNGDQPLQDIALTLPHVTYAETSGGTALDIYKPTDDDAVPAIRFGTLASGESATYFAWLDAAPQAVPSFASDIRVGAAAGVDGRVALRGLTTWMGADLETLPWARWFVAAVLAFVLVCALLALFWTLVTWVRAQLSRTGHASAREA